MKHSIVKLSEMSPVESSQEWKENISLFSSHNIIIDAKAKKADFEEHWGPLSVKCAFNGTENYYSKNFEYKVNDSAYLVFNEGKYYGSYIESDTEVESFTIHFSPDYAHSVFHSLFTSHQNLIDNPFESVNKDFHFSEHLRPHDTEISPIIFKIREQSKDGKLHDGSMEELYLPLLYQLVVKQAKIKSSLEEIKALRLTTKSELMKRLDAGRDFIIHNYRSDISIDDISRVACLNKFYFLRLFNKTFKATPHQYLTQLRLVDASRQLKITKKSITEICNDVGFSDLASFSKLFKLHYKFSPSEYRIHFS